jgi:hypothetical protein
MYPTLAQISDVLKNSRMTRQTGNSVIKRLLSKMAGLIW